MRQFSAPFCFVLVLACTSPLLAVEIKSKVISVEGNTVKVSSDAELVPVAGDKAEIVMEIPGLNDVALVASGNVAAVSDDVIRLSITRAPGKIVVGQQVRIASANPAQRGKGMLKQGIETPKKTEETVPKNSTGPLVLHSTDSVVYSVAISPDGRRILAASSGGQVTVWDSTGKETSRLPVVDTEVFNAMDFSPDARFVLFGNSEGGVSIRDVTTSKELIRGQGDSTLYSVAFSRDGRRFLSGSGEYSAKIDENTLGKRGRDEHTIVLWDAQTGRELKRFPGNRFRVIAVTFSPDGQRVAAGCKDGAVRVWDLASGKKLLEFIEPDGWEIKGVDFSPDGRYVLLANGDRADVDDARVGQELSQSLANTGQPVTEPPSIEPNASVDDRLLRLLEVDSGKEVRHFRGHTSPVCNAVFSPDGRRILSGGSDQTVRLWDVATGKELARLTGHTQSVFRVAFSPDGKLAISGDVSGEVRVWPIPR